MANLKDLISSWESFNFDEYLNSVKGHEIEAVLSKDEINEYDLLSLLSSRADNYLEDIAIRSRSITDREFGKTIQVYTPLYLSSYCKNRCIYCGFNEDNSIPRTKLSIQELRLECERLAKLGIKHVLLLTGGDRVNTPMDYIAESVEEAKDFFDSISIEMYAMSQTEYKRLISLGVDNVTIYQETYNKGLYKQVHLSG